MPAGSATSLPGPVLQKQNRNKHSSTPHLLRMAVAWLSPATPALASTHRWQSESPPRSIGERGAHPLRRQGFWGQAAWRAFTHCRPARWGVGGCQPLAQVPGGAGSPVSAVTCGRGAGETQGGKAAVRRAAACFWAQLLRHVTVVTRTLKTGAGAACSCLGTRSVPLRLPCVTTNPERGNLP